MRSTYRTPDIVRFGCWAVDSALVRARRAGVRVWVIGPLAGHRGRLWRCRHEDFSEAVYETRELERLA